MPMFEVKGRYLRDHSLHMTDEYMLGTHHMKTAPNTDLMHIEADLQSQV
jgi:hypothetical protein